MIRYIKLFFILFLLCLRVETASCSESLSIEERLSRISKEDYKILDKLFRTLMIDNYLAYTLHGSKPMSHKGASYEVLTRNRTKDNEGDYTFLTYWEVWKKYASRPEFQTPNYAFLEKKFPELFEIHFVNKKNVLACVKAHLLTFKEILGDDTTPEKVYNDMLNCDDVYESLGKSQILYGILFGFGEGNSRGFYYKFELEHNIAEPTSFHNEEQRPNHLSLPYFQVFGNNRETNLLRKTYQQERRHILSLYSKGDFLEVTLRKLLSND